MKPNLTIINQRTQIGFAENLSIFGREEEKGCLPRHTLCLHSSNPLILVGVLWD